MGFNALLAVACLGAAAGLFYTRVLVQRIDTVSVSQATRNDTRDAKDPINYLIIGTDSAATLDESDPVNNGRDNFGELADVIMVLRVDPRSGEAWLLSIPRDSLVPISPSGRDSKINSALGGPNGAADLIQTIKRNFGVSVDHYVQIDFRAFKQIVQVLGGVPAYFTNPVVDDNTGLNVEETGCVVLDRDEALAYARARHLRYQQPDGTWVTDPRGDLGRIPRQQQFAKLLIHKALGNGIRNPGKALGVANSVIGVVKIDQQLTVQQLVDVGAQFRTFSSDQLKTYPLPTYDYTTPNGAYQKVDWEEARTYLRVFQGLESGEATVPRDVIVDVVGDTSENTDLVSSALGGLEFDSSTIVDNTSRDVPLVTYGPEGATGALLIARAIDGPIELRYNDQIEGQRVQVELGDLRPTVAAELRPEGEVDPEVLAELVEAGATTEGGDNPPTTLGDPDAVAAEDIATDGGETPTAGTDDTAADDAATGDTATGDTGTGDTAVDGGATDDAAAADQGGDEQATGDDATGQDGSSTTTALAPGETPPEPGLTGSEQGAFVPIDYQRSLACPG
ncbi:MAG: LCP family protein [Microthrixaceae bacterium]|nr:LCP family protein [Microthrixaceae bacterium]